MTPAELDRLALREILKCRKDSGSREDALALAKLLLELKQRRLIKAGLAKKTKR